jgi:hypothetical protein
VRAGAVGGPVARAWWYDPRTAKATLIGELDAAVAQTFTPPGDGPDWVLVLDDAARGFGEPGTEVDR